MTSKEIRFSHVDRFVAGTVGLPGERAFFLQVRDSNRLFSLSLEKIQVQALAERISILLREIRISEPLLSFSPLSLDTAPLETPIDDEFTVGEIAIAFDENMKIIEIELDSFQENEDDQELVRIHIELSLAQADAFAKRSSSLVLAGRPPCPFCGGPINKNGHLCPRANGYRR